MITSGMTQRDIAKQLGVSQPAISLQLRSAPDFGQVPGAELLKAASPILKELARQHGFTQLAVFGSIARGDAGRDSDIDLLVRAPRGTSSFDFISIQQLIGGAVGRKVDLIEYGGLKPGIDDDIRREAVLL